VQRRVFTFGQVIVTPERARNVISRPPTLTYERTMPANTAGQFAKNSFGQHRFMKQLSCPCTSDPRGHCGTSRSGVRHCRYLLVKANRHALVTSSGRNHSSAVGHSKGASPPIAVARPRS